MCPSLAADCFSNGKSLLRGAFTSDLPSDPCFLHEVPEQPQWRGLHFEHYSARESPRVASPSTSREAPPLCWTARGVVKFDQYTSREQRARCDARDGSRHYSESLPASPPPLHTIRGFSIEKVLGRETNTAARRNAESLALLGSTAAADKASTRAHNIPFSLPPYAVDHCYSFLDKHRCVPSFELLGRHEGSKRQDNPSRPATSRPGAAVEENAHPPDRRVRGFDLAKMARWSTPFRAPSEVHYSLKPQHSVVERSPRQIDFTKGTNRPAPKTCAYFTTMTLHPQYKLVEKRVAAPKISPPPNGSSKSRRSGSVQRPAEQIAAASTVVAKDDLIHPKIVRNIRM